MKQSVSVTTSGFKRLYSFIHSGHPPTGDREPEGYWREMALFGGLTPRLSAFLG